MEGDVLDSIKTKLAITRDRQKDPHHLLLLFNREPPGGVHLHRVTVSKSQQEARDSSAP